MGRVLGSKSFVCWKETFWRAKGWEGLAERKALRRERDKRTKKRRHSRGYTDGAPFFSKMSQALDYTINAKQIKIKQNPKEIKVKVTCGEVECETTVYQMQKYSRA